MSAKLVAFYPYRKLSLFCGLRRRLLLFAQRVEIGSPGITTFGQPLRYARRRGLTALASSWITLVPRKTERIPTIVGRSRCGRPSG